MRRLPRDNTRALRAFAVRLLLLFRGILQVRIILKVLTGTVPERTKIDQQKHLPAPIAPLELSWSQPVLGTRRGQVKTTRAHQHLPERIGQDGRSPGSEHAYANCTVRAPAEFAAAINHLNMIKAGKTITQGSLCVATRSFA